MLYTFETQWPAPFDKEWKRSGRTFHTAAEVLSAIQQWMLVNLENDNLVACRIVVLSQN